jgi:hypothetical protein
MLTGTAGIPALPASAAGVPGLVWTRCAEVPDGPAVQCATLRVPVDWSHPRGETIELALARRTAADPAAPIGTLLFDPAAREAPVWTTY